METTINFQAELQSCPLLAGLTRQELAAFGELVHFEKFPAGSDILTEGKNYHSLWIIVSGMCEVVKHGPHRDSRLATLEPGNVFGEMSFLEEASHSASVRAIGDVETVRLMRDKFEELSISCPSAARKIAVNIVHVVSDRLRRMDHWICELIEHETEKAKEWHEFRAKLYNGLFE